MALTMDERIEACQRLLAHAPEGEDDEYAKKQLRGAVLEHVQRPKRALADVQCAVDGEASDRPLDALLALGPEAELSVKLYHPDLSENWDYDTPTKSMCVGRKGVGWLEHFHYDPYSFEKWNFEERFMKSRAMFMGHFTHYFVPESIKTHTRRTQQGLELPYSPKLSDLEGLRTEVLAGKVIPFALRLCAYTQEARHSFAVDLLDGALVRDFRAGALPPKGRLFRSSLDCLAFDRVYVSEKLPGHVAGAFVMVFERAGTTVFDLSQVTGLNERSARNTLGALVARGLVRKEGAAPRETYEVDMETVRKLAESR
jgi:hypothetical protein